MEYQEQRATQEEGGSKLSTFRWDQADQQAGDTYAGKVSEDIFWERIECSIVILILNTINTILNDLINVHIMSFLCVLSLSTNQQ